MHPAVLSVHTGLATSSRLYSATLARAQGRSASDLVATLLLLGAGVSAALATVLLDWKLRIPGHAIVRAVFPMALGLALAPRRMGGVVMGAGALGSALALRAAGFTLLGAGALTSLTLTGPFLDAALWRARRGWQLGAGFALAGLASNLAALVARTGTKLMGLDHPAARPLAEWWFQAVGTYAACGALAGLISALVWFRCVARHGTERSGHTNGSP